MNHLKTIFFLLVCLAVGVGIGQAYVWLRQPHKRGFEHYEGPPVVTGIGDAPAYRGFTVGADRLPTAELLAKWDETFATTVGITREAGLTEKALAEAVSLAHSHSLFVVLLPPHLGVDAGGEKDPFAGSSLTSVAAMAQNARVDYLCVSDLASEPDASYWRKAIEEVRREFKGAVILAARPEIAYRVDCWDLADLVGIVGPVQIPQRLPSSPDGVELHDLRVAWDCTLTSLESLAKVNGKKLALLNMDVPVTVAARLPSPAAANVTPAKNPKLQRMIYEALLLETKGRAEMTTMLLFDWGDPGQADTPNNVPGLMNTIRDDWDPQKPLLPETAPTEQVPADAERETMDN